MFDIFRRQHALLPLLGMLTLLSATAHAASFRFDKPRTLAAAEQPVSLTASDGTGLKLEQLKIDAVLEGMLAFTEVKMTFSNPKNRIIEGRFSITLPEGARLSRFAMKVGKHWQEGEVVEKQRARRAYEDFLHRKQDPALLEDTGTRTFTARVFPIPAQGIKELILSYSHILEQKDAPYVFPLRGMPSIGALDVEVQGGAQQLSLHKKQYTPAKDAKVPQRKTAREAILAGRKGLIRVTPVTNMPKSELKNVYFLVDTSASRAASFGDEIKMLGDLVEALAQGAGNIPIRVDAFDQELATIYLGKAKSAAAKIKQKLKQRRSLGATNLELALEKASKNAKGFSRLVLVTDGATTLGARDITSLQQKILALKKSGIQRVDVLTVGAAANPDRLRALVTAGLTEDGAVIDGNGSYTSIARSLTRKTLSNLKVFVEGAKWVWPEKLDAMQEDESAVIAVIFERPMKAIRGRIGGAPFRIEKVARANGPLLARSFAGSQLDQLTTRHSSLPTSAHAKKKALQDEIIALSVRERVLCPLTALLVLETDADYKRFNITQKSLTDILVVESGEVAVKKRDFNSIAKAPPPKPRAKPKPMKKIRTKKRSAPGASSSRESDAVTGAASTESAEEEAPMMESAEADSALPSPAPVERERRVAQPAPAFSEPIARNNSASTQGMGSVGRGRAGGGDGRGALQERSAPNLRRQAPPKLPESDPWSGKFKTIQLLLGADGKGILSANTTEPKARKAKAQAWRWREENPGDVLALVALGKAAQASGDSILAARAYGSVVDLFPARADLLRFAGTLLASLPQKSAGEITLLAYERAREERMDHPNSHRFLGWALARQGKLQRAWDIFAEGLKQNYPQGRFHAAKRILSEDLGLVAAMRIAKNKKKRKQILAELKKAGGTVENAPSIRFVMSWETDANDVDFHIYDQKGGHAYFSATHLPSGGDLYADVTTGYGPECFTVRAPKKQRAGPYVLMAHYYSRGPMGYGMGGLDVIEHDGNGHIQFETRPFVVMKDGAYLHLGKAR